MLHYTNCAHKINGELLLWQKNGEYNCKLDVSYKIPTKTKKKQEDHSIRHSRWPIDGEQVEQTPFVSVIVVSGKSSRWRRECGLVGGKVVVGILLEN